MYYSGTWVAGTYSPQEVVRHEGTTWLCLVTTTDEPDVSSTDWVAISGGGSAVRGYGGITIGSNKSYPNITTTWTPINLWDSVNIPALNCTISAATGKFSLGLAGFWELTLQMDLTHDEANAGRHLSIRAFNETDAIPYSSVLVGTGRNSGVTAFMLQPWQEILPTTVNDVFRLEWSSTGLPYASVVALHAGLRLEYKGAA
jgi:hypothetical protein